jgi:hypothetical protein
MVYEGYSALGVAFAGVLIALDIILLKRHKVSSGTFARWLVIGIAAGIVSLIPALVTLIAFFLGTEFLLSAATIVSFLFLLILILYLDYRLGNIENKLTMLVASMASAEYSLVRKDDVLTEQDKSVKK